MSVAKFFACSLLAVALAQPKPPENYLLAGCQQTNAKTLNCEALQISNIPLDIPSEIEKMMLKNNIINDNTGTELARCIDTTDPCGSGVLQAQNLVNLPSTVLELQIQSNGITGIAENAFVAVGGNLQILRLFGNDFVEILTNSLAGLNSLTTLYINNNVNLAIIHTGAFDAFAATLSELFAKENDALKVIEDNSVNALTFRPIFIDMTTSEGSLCAISPPKMVDGSLVDGTITCACAPDSGLYGGEDGFCEESSAPTISPTASPVTSEPTTPAPTTVAPTTAAPTTPPPTTPAPTTLAPTTAAPTTPPPTPEEQNRATDIPTTQAEQDRATADGGEGGSENGGAGGTGANGGAGGTGGYDNGNGNGNGASAGGGSDTGMNGGASGMGGAMGGKSSGMGRGMGGAMGGGAHAMGGGKAAVGKVGGGYGGGGGTGGGETGGETGGNTGASSEYGASASAGTGEAGETGMSSNTGSEGGSSNYGGSSKGGNNQVAYLSMDDKVNTLPVGDLAKNVNLNGSTSGKWTLVAASGGVVLAVGAMLVAYQRSSATKKRFTHIPFGESGTPLEREPLGDTNPHNDYESFADIQPVLADE